MRSTTQVSSLLHGVTLWFGKSLLTAEAAWLLLAAPEDIDDFVINSDWERERSRKFIKNPNYSEPMEIKIATFTKKMLSGPTATSLQIFGVFGTAYSLNHAREEIQNSEQPIRETAHQGGLFIVGIKAGAAGATRSVVPCARLGMAVPEASTYIVPSCIAAGSIAAGVAATTGTEIVYEAVVPR